MDAIWELLMPIGWLKDFFNETIPIYELDRWGL